MPAVDVLPHLVLAVHLQEGVNARHSALDAGVALLVVEHVADAAVAGAGLVVLQPDPLRELVLGDEGQPDAQGITGGHEVTQHEHARVAGQRVQVGAHFAPLLVMCADAVHGTLRPPAQPVAVPGIRGEQRAVGTAHHAPATLLGNEVARELRGVTAAAVEVVAAEQQVVELVLQDLEGHAIHASKAALRVAGVSEQLSRASGIGAALSVPQYTVAEDHHHMVEAVRRIGSRLLGQTGLPTVLPVVEVRDRQAMGRTEVAHRVGLGHGGRAQLGGAAQVAFLALPQGDHPVQMVAEQGEVPQRHVVVVARDPAFRAVQGLVVEQLIGPLGQLTLGPVWFRLFHRVLGGILVVFDLREDHQHPQHAMRAKLPPVLAARQAGRVTLRGKADRREQQKQEQEGTHASRSYWACFGRLYKGTVLQGSPHISERTSGRSFAASST